MHSNSSADSPGALVFIHSFAEEMNKCRRMAALQSRAFADAGWSKQRVKEDMRFKLLII